MNKNKERKKHSKKKKFFCIKLVKLTLFGKGKLKVRKW